MGEELLKFRALLKSLTKDADGRPYLIEYSVRGTTLLRFERLDNGSVRDYSRGTLNGHLCREDFTRVKYAIELLRVGIESEVL